MPQQSLNVQRHADATPDAMRVGREHDKPRQPFTDSCTKQGQLTGIQLPRLTAVK